MALYSDSEQTRINKKLGEVPSVFDFGARGNGVTDDSEAFQRALDSTAAGAGTATGGGAILIPGGYTFALAAPVIHTAAHHRTGFVGQGPSSKTKRIDDMPAGKGLFDLTGSSGSFLRNFAIDGNVLAPTRLRYGVDFVGVGGDDPMAAPLTLNSSVWLHEGCEEFDIDLLIEHTGGYSCLLDSRNGNIQNGRLRARLRNCRPHLFGTDVGDLNYGAWTSGVLVKNDGRAGSPYSCENVHIEVEPTRITGNGFWMHSYGFDFLHRDLRIWVRGSDIGRDACLIGALVGGSVDVVARRVGYITETDVDAPVPRWLQNHWAVGIDVSGVVQGVDIRAQLTSVCGGYADLDGLSRSSVDVVAIRPEAGSPEYIEDSIASIPAGASYGAQVSDTSGNIGGQQVQISGTFRNLDGGAVRLFAAHGCMVTGCNIEHPADASTAPIVIGNTGAALDQRSFDNLITRNRISWSPLVQAAAIQEWGNALGKPAFTAGDKNWVSGNTLVGNCFEFLRAAESGSTTEVRLATLNTTATRSDAILVREGTGEDSYTSLYRQIGVAAGDLVSRWYDRFPLGGGAFGGPLLNVSKNGVAKSGSVALGDAVSLSFDHAFYGGKMLAEAFIAAKNYSAYTGADTAANTLSDDWALLRWNKTAVKWQQSVSVAAGARVWTDFASGGAPGGADGHIQYKDAGAFAGEAALAWDKTLKRQTVTGLTGTAGLVLDTCFLQGTQGVLMVRNDGGACYTLQRTAATAAIYQHAVGGDGQYYFLRADAGGATYSFNSIGAATTQVRLGQAGSGDRQNILDFVSDAGIYGMRLDRAAGANGAGALFFRGTGGFFLVCEDSSGIAFYTNGGQRFSIGGLDGWLRNNDGSVIIDQAGNISFTGVATGNTVGAGVNIPTATATNAIQAPSGGILAKWLSASEQLRFVETAEPGSLSPAGQAWFHVNNTSHKLRFSANGSAWADVAGAGATPGGASGNVQYNNGAGGFAGSGNLNWNNPSQQLTVTGVGGTAAIDVTSGYVQSSGGFSSLSFAANALNLPNGGARAIVFTSNRNDGDDGFILDTSVRDWGLRVGGANGDFFVYDRTSFAARVTVRGNDGWVDISQGLYLRGSSGCSLDYNSGQFRLEISRSLYCPGISCEGNGVGGNLFRFWNGSSYENGVTQTGSYTNFTIKGGIIVAAS